MKRKNSYYSPKYTTSREGENKYKIINPSKRSYKRSNIRRNNSNMFKIGFAALGIIGLIISLILLFKSLIVAFKIATVYIGAILAPIVITLVIAFVIGSIICAVKFFKR